MNSKECLNFLGLTRRAGKLIAGHDAVKESIIKSKAKIVLVASDASERLKNEFSYACGGDKKKIPIVFTPFTMQDFGSAIGKNSAVYSVSDTSFAQKIEILFEEELDDQ